MPPKGDQFRSKILAEEHRLVSARGQGNQVCLVYPNQYSVGLDNLGFQIIYALLNRRPDTVCQRSFFDPALGPFSLETGRPLNQFPVVAFSLSYELDYLNFLKILQQAAIPLFSRERDERHPLVMVGGPCAFSNPEPIADFVDLVAVGEGEEIVNKVMDIIWGFGWKLSKTAKASGQLRRAVLQELASVPGVYVPQFYQPTYDSGDTLQGYRLTFAAAPWPVQRVAASPAAMEAFPAHSVVVNRRSQLRGAFLIEITRGCPHHCAFCLASHIYPWRTRPLASLAAIIRRPGRQSGSTHLGLMGSAIYDHPQLMPLIELAQAEGFTFSLSSLRPQALSDHMLRSLQLSGQRTITLAPEVASAKLQGLIKKAISTDSIAQVAYKAQQYQIPHLRLYYMIGLPKEEDQDVVAIGEAAKEIREAMLRAWSSNRSSLIPSLTLSVNPLVPKPFTPLSRVPMASEKVLRRRLRILQTMLRPLPHLRLRNESVRWAVFQAILARGDRRLAPWLAQMTTQGLSLSQALKLRNYPLNSFLQSQEGFVPWNTIAGGS